MPWWALGQAGLGGLKTRAHFQWLKHSGSLSSLRLYLSNWPAKTEGSAHLKVSPDLHEAPGFRSRAELSINRHCCKNYPASGEIIIIFQTMGWRTQDIFEVQSLPHFSMNFCQGPHDPCGSLMEGGWHVLVVWILVESASLIPLAPRAVHRTLFTASWPYLSQPSLTYLEHCKSPLWVVLMPFWGHAKPSPRAHWQKRSSGLFQTEFCTEQCSPSLTTVNQIRNVPKN